MLTLPPLNIPIMMSLDKLTQQVRQVEQMVNQTTGQPRLIAMNVDTSGAQRSVQALTAQMRALTAELQAQVADASRSRMAIADLAAQQASLRAQLAATVVTMREQGAATKDIAAATAPMRVGIAATAAAIAEQRRELTASTEAQRQYRGAITETRAQLAALDADNRKAAESMRTTANAARGSGGGGSPGFLSGLTSSSALGQGVAFGAGAMVGREAFDLLGRSVSAAKDSIIGFNGSMEQSKIAFTTFLGGTQQATAFLGQLQQFAMQTPFEFPELVEDTKKMLAFGFSAQQVIPMLTAVGNAAAGLASGAVGIDRITLALGQMQAKGKVEQQDLRQLQEAGVATGEIMAIIAQETGTTTAQVVELGQKGQLSAQLFIAAFQKWSEQKFGNMMEQQSHTFQGAMSNIHDAANMLIAQLGEPLFQAVSRAAQAISTFAQSAQFAAWARGAAQAVQSVISLFGQLLHAAADVGRGLGLPVPHLDMGGGDNGTAAKAQQDAAEGAASAQAEAVRQGIQYTKAASDAADQIKRIDSELNGVREKQDTLTNAIADTKQGYEDQIAPLERQLKIMDQLTDGEKARQVRSNELEGQEIQIRLAMPDTSGVDAAIEQLKRDKEDLGKFDSSQWDTALDGLHNKLDAISREDTKSLQHAMEGVQEQLYQLGKQNTDALDKQIQGLRDKIDSLSTAQIDAIDKNLETLQTRLKGLNTDDLDRQIDALKAKLDEPAPDTSGMTNQLSVLGAQLQMGGGEAVRQQFASLSAQKAGILNNYQLQQSGLKGQIATLTAERAARKLANDEEKATIEATIAELEAQKKTIQDTNAEKKAGWEAEIKAIEAQKRDAQDRIDQQRRGLEDQLHGMELTKRAQDEDRVDRRQAVQDQIDDLTKAKEAARAIFQSNLDAIDENIRALTRQKEDALAPYNAALKRIDAEKQIIGLQNQQDALSRKIAEAPIKEAVDGYKLAMEDALAPLNRQQQALDRQARTLEGQKRSWDEIRAAATEAAKAIETGTATPPGGTPPGGTPPGGTQQFVGPMEQTGIIAFVERARTKLADLTASDDWSVVMRGQHLDGSPVSSEERWTTALDGAFHGLDTLDKKFKQWIKDHTDNNATVDILFFGENPDGTRASELQQFQAFLDLLGRAGNAALKKMGVDWTSDWDDTGNGLRRGWNGPNGFTWANIGHFFTDIAGGHNDWQETHFPAWLTSWGGLGRGLRTAWDGADGFTWTNIGHFFGGINEGVDGWLQAHTPGWLTSWDTLGLNLRSAWDGPQSFNWTNIGRILGGINEGVDGWMKAHMPGWTTDWTSFVDGLGAIWGGLPTALTSPINAALGLISSFIGKIVEGINKVGEWFDIQKLKDVRFEGITLGAKPASTPGGGAPGLLALGTDNWRGGPAIVGEAGRELVHRGGGLTGRAKGPGEWEIINQASLIHLPQGSTVLPNSVTEAILRGGVPGFAGGLLGDALGGLVHLVGGVAGRGLDWLIDQATGSLPDLRLPGILSDVGPAIVDAAKTGLIDLIRGLFSHQDIGQNLGSVGGGITGGGPAPTGEWAEVVRQAIRHIGEGGWDGWCEKFQNDMDIAAGFGARRHDTAYLHAIDTTLYGGQPPTGASIFFDKSWSWAGHAAIATGNGNQAVSTPIVGLDSVGYANIVGAPGYMGWAPPGLATGGIVTQEGIFRLAEGGKREAVIPLDKGGGLPRGVLDGGRSRDSDEGGPPVVIFEAGAITVDKDGAVTVNDDKMRFTRARRRSGIPG